MGNKNRSLSVIGVRKGLCENREANNINFSEEFPPPSECCVPYLKSFVVWLGIVGDVTPDFCNFLITKYGLQEV